MKHISSEIQALIQKSFDGSITADEKIILDDWYYNFSPEDIALLSDEAGDNISTRIKNRLNDYVYYETRSSRHRKQSALLKAAVALSVICISALLYYVLSTPDKPQKRITTTNLPEKLNDIAPGTNKAILTLANGHTIILDSSSNGQLGKQGDAKLIKPANGQLYYVDDNPGNKKDSLMYNSVTTPRGGQYQVVLADGSKAWLNASSSLRFPAEFRDSIREVEITGEVYFEIAHNVLKPFRVKVKDMYVNVLGTHFNVMAYDNEPVIKTTLLEGSLKVENKTASKLIKPGQQANLSSKGGFELVSNADIDEVMAWKNGRFLFNSTNIQAIMRQVERWYDVDVVFEREGDIRFTGELSRYANVSQLLRKLELTNEIHFRIEKGRITVLP